MTIVLGLIALVLILSGLWLAWSPLALIFAGFVLLRAAALIDTEPLKQPAGRR